MRRRNNNKYSVKHNREEFGGHTGEFAHAGTHMQVAFTGIG